MFLAVLGVFRPFGDVFGRFGDVLGRFGGVLGRGFCCDLPRL